MKVSIVIPFHNEADNVDSVLEETRRANPESEIIAVNDGSSDETETIIRKHPDVRLISFERRLGQSAALYAGLKSARGEFCVMMDGDGQSDPADIAHLVSKLDEADLVCGYRRNRQDNWSRRITSRLANVIRRLFLRDTIRDTGCTLKAMRRSDLRHLVPFDGLHRFLPMFFQNAGLRVTEVPVNHRPRFRNGQKTAVRPSVQAATWFGSFNTFQPIGFSIVDFPLHCRQCIGWRRLTSPYSTLSTVR